MRTPLALLANVVPQRWKASFPSQPGRGRGGGVAAAGVRNCPLRNYVLSTDLPAPVERAAALLRDVAGWPRWNRLVPRGTGEVAPGEMLTFHIRQPGGGHYLHRARVLELGPHRVVLSAVLLHRFILRMDHTFEFLDLGPGRCRLEQRWAVSGLLTPLLWGRLVRAMARFAELGDDLAVSL